MLPQRLARLAVRTTRKRLRLRQAQRRGIQYVPPNFIYRNTISRDDVVLDAGCGDDADFSKYMIRVHNVRAFGIDPTRRHAPALARLENELCGRFHHLPVAVATHDRRLTFYESDDNVSGSLLEDHVNVEHDRIHPYDVDSLSLPSLLRRLGLERVALLKLDLEGAEYELLSHVGREALRPFDQLFVEFHHHAVARFSQHDTWRVVHRIQGFGFSAFSLDDHNFLFYQGSARE